MISAEINELRKQGKLQAAEETGLKALEENPDDIWVKRALSWVYYDSLKKASNEINKQDFLDALRKIQELELPDDETMFYDKLPYVIGKFLFALNRQKNNEPEILTHILDLIKDFNFPKPSESYSFLLKAFRRHAGYWSGFLNFMDWWGMENFRDKDFEKEEMDGRKIPSLVEMALISYSKKLLEAYNLQATDTSLKDRIKNFIKYLNQIIRTHPDYLYLILYKTKLLSILGYRKEAIQAFLPFARKKKMDFWVWNLLADLFEQNDAKKFYLLNKALSIPSNDNYKVKLHEKIIPLFLKRKMFDEAKTEVNAVINIRTKNNWTIPAEIFRYQHQGWYHSARDRSSNRDIYQKFSPKAEEILFIDIPEELIVISALNAPKNIAYFVVNKNISGFFKYNRQPVIGKLYHARLQKRNNGFYKLLTIREADEAKSSPALKIINEKINLHPKGFGFTTSGVFVPAQIVQKYDIQDGENIQAKVILSYDKLKKKWGWKVLEIFK